MIFARFPLVRYKLDLAEGWALNGGLTESNTQVSTSTIRAGQRREPRAGFRLQPARRVGRTSATCSSAPSSATSARKDPTFGTNSVFGWGLNLAGEVFFSLPWKPGGGDLLGAQLTYGEGIGRYGNDSSFFATDAAYNSQGDLEALPYFGAFIGYTHRWLPDWRSTATYGWVKVDGDPVAGTERLPPDATTPA